MILFESLFPSYTQFEANIKNKITTKYGSFDWANDSKMKISYGVIYDNLFSEYSRHVCMYTENDVYDLFYAKLISTLASELPKLHILAMKFSNESTRQLDIVNTIITKTKNYIQDAQNNTLENISATQENPSSDGSSFDENEQAKEKNRNITIDKRINVSEIENNKMSDLLVLLGVSLTETILKWTRSKEFTKLFSKVEVDSDWNININIDSVPKFATGEKINTQSINSTQEQILNNPDGLVRQAQINTIKDDVVVNKIDIVKLYEGVEANKDDVNRNRTEIAEIRDNVLLNTEGLNKFKDEVNIAFIDVDNELDKCVKLDGVQTINDIKIFNNVPIIAAIANYDFDAANKIYVDQSTRKRVLTKTLTPAEQTGSSTITITNTTNKTINIHDVLIDVSVVRDDYNAAPSRLVFPLNMVGTTNTVVPATPISVVERTFRFIFWPVQNYNISTNAHQYKTLTANATFTITINLSKEGGCVYLGPTTPQYEWRSNLSVSTNSINLIYNEA